MHSPIRRRCTSESFAPPYQLILSIVLVGDEGRPLGDPLGDRGYVPVVVVDVGVGRVAAVLVCGQQSL